MTQHLPRHTIPLLHWLGLGALTALGACSGGAPADGNADEASMPIRDDETNEGSFTGEGSTTAENTSGGTTGAGAASSGGDAGVPDGTGGTLSTGGDGAPGGTDSGGTTSTGGTTASGGAPSGGAPGAGGSDPGARCDAGGLTWKSARKTHYTSYPDPGSEECIKYNGCTWAGWFAGCDNKQTESWVSSHNIAAVFPGFSSLAGHEICIRSGAQEMIVHVVDTCGDSDCNGCCTQNQGSNDALVDLESYTNARWGLQDGIIQWADLGPAAVDICQ